MRGLWSTQATNEKYIQNYSHKTTRTDHLSSLDMDNIKRDNKTHTFRVRMDLTGLVKDPVECVSKKKMNFRVA